VRSTASGAAFRSAAEAYKKCLGAGDLRSGFSLALCLHAEIGAHDPGLAVFLKIEGIRLPWLEVRRSLLVDNSA
jgi:hypothetical protein